MRKNNRLKKLLGKGFLIFCIQLWATVSIWGGELYGQQHKIVTVELKNVTLLDALEYLTNVVGCEILYNHEQVKSERTFDLDMKEKTLEEVLQKCLEGTSLSYKIVDDVFVLTSGDDEKEKKEAREITGVVVSEQGDSIPGVTVLIKGTTLGTSTDEKGCFKIAIPSTLTNVKLVFSFVGMDDSEIAIEAKKNHYRVILLEKEENLEEVVVTGISRINKKSFSGSSVTVTRDEILKVSKSNVLSALETFAPSFRIERSNLWGSDPNRMPEMYVSGRTGIGTRALDRTNLESNPNLPTFILDGIEVDAQKIYDMDPNRIESITLLKDAAATAMYGSRASNGVIVVTTIPPRAGKINVTYNLTGSVSMPSLKDYNMMNAAELLEAERLAGFYDEELSQDEYYAKLKLIREGVDTDWLAQPLRNAWNHKHSLRLDGGEQNFRFGLDLGYDRENGVMKESYRENISLGLKLDYRLKDYLQVVNNTTYESMNSENSPYGTFSDYTSQRPYDRLKDEYGNYLKQLEFGTDSGKDNPLYEATLKSYDKSDYEEIANTLQVIWYLADGMKLDAGVSVTKKWDTGKRFLDPKSQSEDNNSVGDDFNQLRGKLWLNSGTNINWQIFASLQYNKNIKKHSINATLRYELMTGETSTENSEYQGFPSGDLDSPHYASEIVTKPSFYSSKSRSIGITATGNYMFDNTYFADLSVRFDASSEFGENNRFAPFASIGAGVNIHNYPLVKDNLPWLTEFRLRTSYGQTGQNDGFQASMASSIYQNNTEHWYSSGYGAVLSAMGNPDLKWQKANTWSIGLDINLFNDAFYLKTEYFTKTTVDMITDVTIPSSSGFNVYYDNQGKNENKEWTFDFRTVLLRNEDWYLSIGANLSSQKAKMKEISDALKHYNELVDEHFENTGNSDEWSTPLPKYEEGQSLTSIWGLKSLGIDPATGKELFLNRDGTISYDWTSENQQVIGDEEPAARGNISLNFSYKGLSLFASFRYEFGGDEYNQTLVDKVEDVNLKTTNADKRVLTDRWQKPGDIAKFKSILDAQETNSWPTRSTSRFVQENNFLELGSLDIEYDFSRHAWMKKSFLSTLKVGVSMNDIWRLCSIKQERGLNYPFANTVNFTLRVGF